MLRDSLAALRQFAELNHRLADEFLSESHAQGGPEAGPSWISAATQRRELAREEDELCARLEQLLSSTFLPAAVSASDDSVPMRQPCTPVRHAADPAPRPTRAAPEADTSPFRSPAEVPLSKRARLSEARAPESDIKSSTSSSTSTGGLKRDLLAVVTSGLATPAHAGPAGGGGAGSGQSAARNAEQAAHSFPSLGPTPPRPMSLTPDEFPLAQENPSNPPAAASQSAAAAPVPIGESRAAEAGAAVSDTKEVAAAGSNEPPANDGQPGAVAAETANQCVVASVVAASEANCAVAAPATAPLERYGPRL